MPIIPDYGSFAGGGTFNPSGSGGFSAGNIAGAAGGLFGAASDIFGGYAAAQGSKMSATEYGRAAQVTKEQTAIKELAANRQIYQSLGATQAAVAGNGFQLGGSALDILRSSTQEGALTKGAISLQGAAQEQSYLQQQKEAKAAGNGQLIGGILKGLGEVAGVVAAPFTGGASLALTAGLAAS